MKHTGKERSRPATVDVYIWERHADDANPYAQWVLMHFRLPAVQQLRWSKFMAEHKLFCTYENKRWRVTGASRLGDVWLASDFTRDCGYDTRVNVDACTEWGPTP